VPTAIKVDLEKEERTTGFTAAEDGGSEAPAQDRAA